MIDRACISLNNSCNLRCRYCHFQDKQHDCSYFQLSELITIIDNIHKYCLTNRISAFKLGVVGSGEPMIHKNNVFELLDYIVSQKYDELKLYTITNGVLLSKEDIERFYKYRHIINLCFSLDGYEEIHNYGRARYSDVMDRISWYKEIFGCAPSINTTVNRLSYENEEELVAFFKRNELRNVTFSKLVGYRCSDLYITDEQYAAFMEFVQANGLNSRQFSKERKYDCTMYGRLCGVGRTNIFITPEGIYPCGRFYRDDRYLLGTFDSSIQDVDVKVHALKHVADGKCFYSENVEVNT